MSVQNNIAVFIHSLLKDRLSTGELSIEFIKKDKSVRQMRCTLDEKLIPVENLPNDDRPPFGLYKFSGHINTNNVRVFDLDKNDWRAFNVEQLTSIGGLSPSHWVQIAVKSSNIFPEEKAKNIRESFCSGVKAINEENDNKTDD